MDTCRNHRLRLALVSLLVLGGFIALLWRLHVIQITNHSRYLESARGMQEYYETIPAYRGTVRSRHGVILARDVFDHRVGVDPGFLAPDQLQRVIRVICDAAGKSPEYRRGRLQVALDRKEQGGRYVHLLDDVGKSLVEEIRTALERICSREEREGLVVELKPHRTYPRGTLASGVVGVVNSDEVGIEGVERSMQSYLSGRDGQRNLIHDASWKTWIFNLANAEVAPVRGHDVYLTIDTHLQDVVESELQAGIEREKAEGGSFVLMDCNSGDILALASFPTYDPNHFSEYPEAERRLRRGNKAVESLYEPGSVMKPFLAAYVLEENIFGRDRLVRDLVTSPIQWDGGSHARFGRRVVRDVHAHDDLTLERAVVYSSNICMGIVGYRVGGRGLHDMLQRFGLGRPTGIDLPAEGRSERPYTPLQEWKPLYSSVSVSFGYEVMVSPLQLCRAFAALVNGGYLLKPRILDRIRRGSKLKVFPDRQVEGRPISEETSREMREILRLVVEEGTGKWLKIPGFEYGGKTGTADMARGGYTKSDYLASFEAFAPFENPRVVALCMIEKPRAGSYYGGRVAGPIVAEVLRKMFDLREPTRLSRLLGGAGE